MIKWFATCPKRFAAFHAGLFSATVFLIGSIFPVWNYYALGRTDWDGTYHLSESGEGSLWNAIWCSIERCDWEAWTLDEPNSNLIPTGILLSLSLSIAAVLYLFWIRRLPPDGAEDYGDVQRLSVPPN